MRGQLHIGEVAELLGVTQKTIRHYHKIGLLAQPERSNSNYRLYSAGDLLRLLHIRRLQALGLTLAQIKHVLGEPDHERTLREVLVALADEIEGQIKTLTARKERIQTLLAEDTVD
ncbi:MAG TPA: MerR family transcriptional regulator, partial [Ktedonobacterales bacterium]|nr:MerR family transcriptional regulator [Ktedonobacterales bacterium]